MNPASAVSPSLSFLLLAQPTPLVGRTDELATIRRSLVDGDARLLTLTGPAGVGKTRLALAAAELAAQSPVRFPDGVVVLDLSPVREPPLVLPTIARTFGLTDRGQLPVGERLAAFLRERATLLVLDNVEQVLPAAAVPLADLLAGCPRLVLLVTSRVPLQLRWEQTLRVAPLAVPNLQAAMPPLDALAAVPAVALFVARARARRADFVLSEQNAPRVAELVVQLDGLPLALELAAARLDVLPLSTIARRLRDRLRLLTSEAPDLPERQRSVEAAAGWSYDLLDHEERWLFRCLGVFIGRVSLDAIAAVAGTGGHKEESALERLAALAEKSLVLPVPWSTAGQEGAEGDQDDDPEPAFGMLETVREYAWERLAAAGELAAAKRAHAHYFLALAERADPALRGRDQRAWYLRLEREHANLRAALRWLLDEEEPAEREVGLRLAAALGYFWWTRGYHAEGWHWLDEALACAPAGEGDPAVRTRALIAAGRMLTYRGELDRAHALLEEALARAQRGKDAALIALALTYLGLSAVFAGDFAEAVRVLEEARACWEGLAEYFHLGLTLYFLGAVAFAQGTYTLAEALEVDALAWLAAAGDVRMAGTAHFAFAVTEWQRGDLTRAMQHIREGFQTSITLRDRWLLSFGARAAVALVGANADPAQRACLLGAADALSQATGAKGDSTYERLPTYPSIAPLRERLVQGEWGAAYREGRSLPVEEMVALALRLLDGAAKALIRPEAAVKSPQPPDQLSRSKSPLSGREQEVLRLVAQGLSNKAIGQELFLSPSTVTYHLTSVYHKLAVDTRAQAVAVAVQSGFL